MRQCRGYPAYSKDALPEDCGIISRLKHFPFRPNPIQGDSYQLRLILTKIGIKIAIFEV
jgi:hypothetical protein